MQAYTTALAFLEALGEAGVQYLFANLGSDHPAFIEALHQAGEAGQSVPKVIICPHEMVALSAAHGYAQVSGRPQAVLVHVECGTQNLGGAVHNVAKGRVPVLIFAGASPYTQENELIGSRNEFIHWLQDVHDQRGILRGYMKYDNEIRTGANVKQLVWRALQIAQSDPQGPVYLVGPRETMEAAAPRVTVGPGAFRPLEPAALPATGVQDVAAALARSRRPLIITSYVGRQPGAVKALEELSERLAIPVMESVPSRMNFSSDHPMHCGYQWNTTEQAGMLEAADVVLVLDSDVPWIPTQFKPADACQVFVIDVDPLKSQMPLWYVPAARAFCADSWVALRQLGEAVAAQPLDEASIARRRARIARIHEEQRAVWREREAEPGDEITPEYLTAAIRRLGDDSMVVLSEGISNYHVICNHLQASRPGSLYTSGGGSLGWHGGAAIGTKLAIPEATVVSLVGDGSFFFSIPSSVYWMARKYHTPIFTIIYNNHGWKSPKLSTLGVHPTGLAYGANQFWADLDPAADLVAIAHGAGGGWGMSIRHPHEVEAALRQGLEAVRQGRAAVLNVELAAI